MIFSDTIVVPKKRRWMCEQPGCVGEMESTGSGMTRNDVTSWTHQCNVCGHKDMADEIYPTIIFEVP